MLQITPANGPKLYQQALHLKANGQPEQARKLLTALARAFPNLAEIPFQLGLMALDEGDLPTAAHALQKARSLKPNENAILMACARLAEAQSDLPAALTAFDQTLHNQPKAAEVYAEKAACLQRFGEFEAAEAALRKALRHNPYQGSLYRILVATRKLKKNDPAIAPMRKAYTHPRMSDQGRIELGFALAKVAEDAGEYERVFPYLNTANQLQRKLFPYDPAKRRADQDALLAAQEGMEIPPRTHQGFRPIFVVGMPRSGTTLAEQILGNHHSVTPAGEVGHGLRLASQALATPPLDATACTQLATHYEAAMRAGITFNTCVTDKSIQSHLVMPTLMRALPGARFIMIRRDPRDIALSIYKNYFGEGTHRYGNHLPDIAAAILDFQRVLDHWQRHYPNTFTQIRYENIVANTETQARALCTAAGLEWDPACLEFHKSRTQVKTLSLQQVRQPVYASSKQAWRRYQNELAPFTEAWNALGGESLDVD